MFVGGVLLILEQAVAGGRGGGRYDSACKGYQVSSAWKKKPPHPPPSNITA